MKRTRVCITLCVALLASASSQGASKIWGVNPSATGGELVNIDPLTGSIGTSFALAGITPNHTEIGLAGWSDALYYVNGNVNPGLVTVLDPDNGSTITTFSVSGGWEIDGLGYYGSSGSYLYTSGCSVDDMHRYNASNGASPQFYWSTASDPRAVAGDNGGRIFTYASVAGGNYGIYEINPLVSTNATWFAASPSDSIVGMAFDGLYLYLSDTNGMLYTMNTSGGIVNSLDLGYTFYALASTVGTPDGPVDPVVPVPSAMLLAGIGTSLVSWMRRRRAI